MENDSVLANYDMVCPECGRDDRLHVSATVWVKLAPDGTDFPDSGDGDTEWDDASPCKCNACDRFGTVKDFQADANENDTAETTA